MAGAASHNNAQRMDDDKLRVREASDIVRVVGEHLTLHPKGREFVGLCPFHDDSKPSMYVVPGKQIFHCFACGAGGDVFTFVQRYHGMEFGEAIKFLAERAGIELSKRRAPEPGSTSGPTRRELVEANAFALRYYRAVLEHESHGKAARELLERRDISAKMIERFELGASPDQWDGLASAAARRSGQDAPTARVMEMAGLIKSRENASGHYDALRDRLVFPIHDQVGRVVAFGGRRLTDSDDKGPKYLNSPETPVFNKSRTLYGLSQASRAIQRERVAIVVEGYVDVIACHQFGFENAVGTLGTALTAEHAQMLRRLSDEVILLFDGDEAGQRAAARAVEVFFAEPIDVRIATIGAQSGGESGLKDPDDLLKSEGGPDAFRALLGSAEELFDYRFGRLRASLADKGPAAVDQAVREELRRLVDLGLNGLSPVMKSLALRRISSAARVSESDLRAMLPSGRRSGPIGEREQRQNAAQNNAAQRSGSMSPAEAALGCVLIEPRLARTLDEPGREALRAFSYTSEALRTLASEVLDAVESGEEAGLERVLGRDMGPEATEAAVSLHQRLERETDSDAQRLRRVWEDSTAKLGVASGNESDSSGDLASRMERLRAVAAGGQRAAHPGVKRKT